MKTSQIMFLFFRPKSFSVALVALFIFLTTLSSLHAQTLPTLPPFHFENFESNIGKQLSKAYTEAKAKPLNPAANGQLGMALHAYEQYEFAASCYARALHFAPKELRWHYYFGLTQAALAKYPQAITAFKNALQLEPTNLPAQLRLAEALLAAGQFRDSQIIYEALTKQTATAAQAQHGLGQIKIALGAKDEAVAHYRQALTLFPEYGVVHYSLGLALRDQGKKEEAQQHLILSQQQKYQRPTLDDPLLQVIADLNASATDQLQRGVVLAGMGKLDKSIEAHERALEINPKLIQAHINLISLYAQIGQFEKAEKHYQAAVADNPNLADSHFNYGIILMGLERYREAAAAFQRSLERNPFSADAHYNYAIIIEREGKTDEAAEHYRQALANNPEHRQAHFHYGRVLVFQEKWLEAIEHFHQTITVEDEDTPRFMYALGATYARIGERQKAIQLLQEANKRATALGQKEIMAAITRDLQTLGEKR